MDRLRHWRGSMEAPDRSLSAWSDDQIKESLRQGQGLRLLVHAEAFAEFGVVQTAVPGDRRRSSGLHLDGES